MHPGQLAQQRRRVAQLGVGECWVLMGGKGRAGWAEGRSERRGRSRRAACRAARARGAALRRSGQGDGWCLGQGGARTAVSRTRCVDAAARVNRNAATLLRPKQLCRPAGRHVMLLSSQRALSPSRPARRQCWRPVAARQTSPSSTARASPRRHCCHHRRRRRRRCCCRRCRC